MPTSEDKLAVVIVAAGRSQRFGDPLRKKPFASILGKAIWLYSAEFFLSRSDVGQVVVVIAPEDEESFRSQYAANLAVLGIDVALGGESRGASVARGVQKTAATFRQVAIHDAARPCLHRGWVDRLFRRAREVSHVVPCVPIASTVKRSLDGKTIQQTVDRQHLYMAQTPQIFDRGALLEAIERDVDSGHAHTDESQLMEAAGHTVYWVEGSITNIKITTQEDLRLAQVILRGEGGVRFDTPPLPFSPDTLWR